MKVELIEAKRIGNTRNGNPVWKFITTKGTFRTKPDANWVSSLDPWHIYTGPAELTIEDGYVTGFKQGGLE